MNELTFLAKILGINTSDGVMNLLVDVLDEDKMNIKAPMELDKVLLINHIYFFKVSVKEGTERTSYSLMEYEDIDDYTCDKQDEILRHFQSSSPISLVESELRINAFIEEIKNKALREITANIIQKNKTFFYLFPAGVKYHHAYVGGLAYHTLGMLELSKSFLVNYPFLSKDYLYAGIILHDIGKVREFSGAQNTEYALRGQMLGHLVLGGIMVADEAKELGYDKTEEAMILEHMLISHHGQPQFGAAKKPMTPEALLLWYIDALDSKFRVLGEELAKTEEGSYTDSINVLEKMKIYKPINK